MTPIQHGARVGLLMAAAAVLLGWLSAHTDVLFADGLRYIRQARQIDDGSLAEGLLKAVDHPIYPLAIVAAHRELGGDGPEDWQRAAQAASVLAGVLLVIPLYLVALEIFGPRSAWLAVLLSYAVPETGHVLADTLSEGAFLLFWTWGLWCALRFLKEGRFAWLPPTILCGALAYLTRPEGLLLPAALVTTLAAMPLLRSTRMNWPRWWAAVAFLVVGAGCLVGPYIAVKGGLGTKPAIARLLGTAPKSAGDAVERERPLDPNQTALKTYGLATKAMFEAVRDSVTIPLLPLALVGLVGCGWPFSAKPRLWLFLAIVDLAAVAALVRLHATGGYCSPRHAMVLAFLIIPASAAGLDLILRSIAIPGRWLGTDGARFTAGPAVWALALAGLIAWNGPKTFAPLNQSSLGYRIAGDWIAEHTAPEEVVVDPTGWALFYSRRPGYTFANLIEAPADPRWRYLVVRESHLKGPWWYSQEIRSLVGGREPLITFPQDPDPRRSKVYIFERPLQSAQAPAATDRR